VKSKKTLYLLLPLVALIWGLIGYRVFKMTRPVDGDFESFAKRSIRTDSVTYNKLVPLTLDYRDPFLKETVSIDAENKNDEFASLFANNPEPPKVVIPWPLIGFKGVIVSKNEQLAILEIDGKRLLVSQGKEYNGFRIEEIFTDSITIAFSNEIKTYRK